MIKVAKLVVRKARILYEFMHGIHFYINRQIGGKLGSRSQLNESMCSACRLG